MGKKTPLNKHMILTTMDKPSIIIILIPLLVSLGQTAPVSTDLDSTFATTFEKFFRIKDLIDNINTKHFRALQGGKYKGGAPEIEAIEDASSDKVSGSEEPVLTEIDLTEEAISNDQVAKINPYSLIHNYAYVGDQKSDIATN